MLESELKGKVLMDASPKIVSELHFQIEKQENGLSAYCDHINVYTIGDDFNELKENVRKAINIFYKDYPKDNTTQITIKFKWPKELMGEREETKEKIRLA